jgi:uncharacterized protein YdiU (UPF0061 family)
MDHYNSKTVFSSIDKFGRYSFSNQPPITKWNLARFAECLIPLINKNEDTAVKIATETIENFEKIFEDKWLNMMRDKLGLFGHDQNDTKLIKELLIWMENNKADYTNTFCHLMNGEIKKNKNYENKDFQNWKKRWLKRLKTSNTTFEKCIKLMRITNPLFIARNHKVEEVLKIAEQGNLKPTTQLIEILDKPYTNQDDAFNYQTPSPLNEKYHTFCGT